MRYALMMRFILLLIFVACGGAASKWTPADEATARTEMQTQAALVDFCGGDGGTCTGAQVKIVEQATRCNLGAMLVRHGVDIGDAGDGCRK